MLLEAGHRSVRFASITLIRLNFPQASRLSNPLILSIHQTRYIVFCSLHIHTRTHLIHHVPCIFVQKIQVLRASWLLASLWNPW